jgi:hypothetical protein
LNEIICIIKSSLFKRSQFLKERTYTLPVVVPLTDASLSPTPELPVLVLSDAEDLLLLLQIFQDQFLPYELYIYIYKKWYTILSSAYFLW